MKEKIEREYHMGVPYFKKVEEQIEQKKKS
jgi:hypothetical protein